MWPAKLVIFSIWSFTEKKKTNHFLVVLIYVFHMRKYRGQEHRTNQDIKGKAVFYHGSHL